jgi:hypothetical protein
MEQYPYDASLEWIPREYQGESPAEYERRVRKAEVKQSQGNTGYREYPSVDYPTLPPPQRQARMGQPGQAYQQAHQPGQQGQQRQQIRQRQQAYGATWAASASRSGYTAQARQQQGRATLREAAGGKMSKADALEMLESLKTSILVGAIVGFGVLSAFVATHAVGSSSSSSQSTPNNNFISPNNNNNNNNNSNNPSNNGGFFNQQGGGNGFGSGGYSQPSSGSGVS